MYTRSYTQGKQFFAGLISLFALIFVFCSNAAFAATLTVTSNPGNTTIWEGQTKTFTVTASGASVIQYQWFKDGVRIPNVDLASGKLTLSSATTSAAGTYHATVYGWTSTGQQMKVRAADFNVTVNQIVRITKQPSSVITNVGTTANLSVAATGTGPLSYQWYFNGVAMSGATQSSISTGSAALSDAGKYYVVVKNAGSSATSSTATLSVMTVAKSYAANLTWSAPTKRDNGTALAATDIAGYNIYYGTSSTGSLTKIAALSASDLKYTVSNLSTGTYYFAATTVDRNGVESTLSTRISKTF